MLWLLVPIWISWFFAEFFQEKTGTSFGNAMTNAVVVLWGSIDCTRQTISLMKEGLVYGFANIFARFSLIVILFAYGVIIVILGWRGNKIVKYIGRVREVTYVFAMFTPIFYNAMELTVKHVLAAVIFFPVFYFVIELIDHYTPNPHAVVEDMEEAKEGNTGAGFKNSFGSTGQSDSFDSGAGAGKDPFASTGKVGKDDLGGLDDFKL